MTRSLNKTPKDPRSTQRKRARRVLENVGRPYFCGSRSDGSVSPDGCGRSPTLDSAPGGLYPGVGTLQVNHINKNILDNDPVNLEYLCASCHKEKDSRTEKGESVIENEFGY